MLVPAFQPVLSAFPAAVVEAGVVVGDLVAIDPVDRCIGVARLRAGVRARIHRLRAPDHPEAGAVALDVRMDIGRTGLYEAVVVVDVRRAWR